MRPGSHSAWVDLKHVVFTAPSPCSVSTRALPDRVSRSPSVGARVWALCRDRVGQSWLDQRREQVLPASLLLGVPDAGRTLRADLETRGIYATGLVNNAGFGTHAAKALVHSFTESPLGEQGNGDAFPDCSGDRVRGRS
jgi:hypothetical protein